MQRDNAARLHIMQHNNAARLLIMQHSASIFVRILFPPNKNNSHSTRKTFFFYQERILLCLFLFQNLDFVELM